MPLNTVDFEITADTGRQASKRVWRNCPAVPGQAAPWFENVQVCEDDFSEFYATTNRYKLIQADSGASVALLSSDGEYGGILRGTTGATDENEFYWSG